MELWIRSQDKEVLTKVNNLCYYTRKDVAEFISEEELSKDIQHVIWSPDGSILGYYKTKERALKVLDEIQNLLQPKIIYTQKEPIETYELGVYKLKQDVDMKIQEINRIVYEMPQD